LRDYYINTYKAGAAPALNRIDQDDLSGANTLALVAKKK
jgi:hypothetical protein